MVLESLVILYTRYGNLEGIGRRDGQCHEKMLHGLED